MLLQQLLENKVNTWIKNELDNEQSLIGSLINHINDKGVLRIPQIEAIKVYLWLKFEGKNQKLSDIIKGSLLYDKDIYDQDDFQLYFATQAGKFISRFIYEQQNKKLHNYVYEKRKELDFDKILEELLHDFDYSNYLYSLPMGAGKTYLIASFIYLDLYFAKLFKDDKRFAHNFIIFAPQGSKTAILPSLKTIKNFNPEWILPKESSDSILQEINIEILDTLSSQRKDKLQGNNPNLEKVNRLKQQKDFGLVFITNAEKVILEKFTADDELKINAGTKEATEVTKINELREGLSQLPNLTVILDEVHHVYGKTNDKDEKKLRQAIDVLNQHKHINQVIGVSGTPYVKSSITIGEHTLKIPTIQDIVYFYGLNTGIGKFLKVPNIKSLNVKDSVFVNKALDEFFKDYDIKYSNGTQSKIAFYCPNIETLNKEILPIVNKWYDKNRNSQKEEIFIYYSSSKEYPLPKDSTSIFHNLDKPYSKKRVILLVAIGTEGWDCKSLTSVALPRKQSTKNFVLQTTCRCLREVDDANNEKALIYLSEENYQILDNELQETYQISIADLKKDSDITLPIKIRKPKLGKIAYKQIEEEWILEHSSTITPKEVLQNFNFEYYKDTYQYDTTITSATIGSKGLTNKLQDELILNSFVQDYSIDDLIYKLANYLYVIIDEYELYTQYCDELQKIYQAIIDNQEWIEASPYLTMDELVQSIASDFVKTEYYKKDYITSDVEIELLEWNTQKNIEIADKSGKAYDLLPHIDDKDIRTYQRTPDFYEEDNFGDKNNIDPLDISFNYIPYRMDSKLEINALKAIISQKAFKDLQVFYNGYKDSDLQNFTINTPYGRYTPDFLILKRADDRSIAKILIIETKGKPYYESFQSKETFIKDVFIKHNPQFTFLCVVDEDGNNDFSKHIDKIKELINNF